MPVGTFSNRNVPSAADMTVRLSSSICTVASGIGSPERELSSRPDTATAAWAERVAPDACAISRAHERNEHSSIHCSPEMNHFARRTEQRLPRAHARDGKPLRDLRGAKPHPGLLNRVITRAGDDGGERSGGSATCALRAIGNEVEVNEGAGENGRSGDELRSDVRPERSRPVADQAVQVRRVDPRGRCNETMRVGVVLDCHRQADGIVTVVSVRRES